MSKTEIDITKPLNLADRQELRFTGYATQNNDPKLSPGDVIYFLKQARDDKNIPVYDVATTKKGKVAVESLYADEFEVVDGDSTPEAAPVAAPVKKKKAELKKVEEPGEEQPAPKTKKAKAVKAEAAPVKKAKKEKVKAEAPVEVQEPQEVKQSAAEIDITKPLNLADRQELRFTGYATQNNDPKLSPGDVIYFLKQARDDKNIPVYDVATTKKGKVAVESLYADEFEVVDGDSTPEAAPVAAPVKKKKAELKKVEEPGEEQPAPKTKKAKAVKAEAAPVKKAKKEKVKAEAPVEVQEPQEVKQSAAEVEPAPAVQPEAVKEAEDIKPASTPEPGMDAATLDLIWEHGGDACAAALAIAKDSEAKRFLLGGVLLYIQKTKVYEEEKDSAGVPRFTGQKGFAMFCEQYIGLSYSSAKLYQRIYANFTSMGLGVEDFRRVGTAKAREIVQMIELDFSKDDVEEAIHIGETKTHEELHSHVSSKMQDAEIEGHGLRDKVKCTLYKFEVFADQEDIINAAIRLAMDNGDIKDTDQNALGRAFVSICSDYLQAYSKVAQPVVDETEEFQESVAQESVNA